MDPAMCSVIVKGLSEATNYETLGRSMGDSFGPVKRVDVIRGKGYGFVRFLAEDDAKKAARRKTMKVDGAIVQIQNLRRGEKEKKEKIDKSLCVRLFGSTADDKKRYKRFRKISGFSSFKDDIITFASLKDAVLACRKLDGATVCGEVVRARLETTVRPTRLVVRNVKFTTDLQKLRDAFEPFGPLRDATLLKGFGFVEFESKKDAEKVLKIASKKFVLDGREVAVDRALGKEEYKKQQQVSKTAASQEREEEADEAPPEEEEEEEEDEDEEEVVEETSAAEVEEDDESSSSDRDEESDGEEDVRGDAAEGRTLFVRNVPYGCTARELRECFAESMEVESCHLVKDRETGLAKGTAFVKLAQEITEDMPETVEFQGRDLRITLALPEGVEEPEIQGPSNKRKRARKTSTSDLVNEGLVVRGTDAARGVPEEELMKRERNAASKKRKLTNPLFFVNDTRLSVRNLNDRVTDAVLKKKLCQNKALNVKVLEGGFGFAEFETHEDALEILRLLNNNPSFTSFARGSSSSPAAVPRLLVEFAVENKVKAEQRKERVKAAREKNLLKQQQSPPPQDAQKTTKKKPTATKEKKRKVPEGKSRDVVASDVKEAIVASRWFES